jgi:hypothetical protein
MLGCALAGLPLAALAQVLEGLPDRPLWEAGVAALGAWSPDYPAANTQRWRGALAPIVVYRGKRLRVDDDGVRGRLVDNGRFEFDLTGAAGFNARANPSREGMPPLDYTFELGPQARYRVPLGDGQQVSAHLKLRAVVSTNGRRTHGRGAVLEPEIRWQLRGWPDAESAVQLSGKATWASEELHDYFYQVDPVYATPSRPAFDARGGYFGSALRASIGRRLNAATHLSVSGSLNYHGGSASQDSPLFQRRSTGAVLVALIWTPWRSGESAAP